MNSYDCNTPLFRKGKRYKGKVFCPKDCPLLDSDLRSESVLQPMNLDQAKYKTNWVAVANVDPFSATCYYCSLIAK